MRLQFWLGTHQPHWLALTDVHLFVSHRTLAQRRRLPRASGPWALDSGAFSEVATYGEFQTSPRAYTEAVRRYAQEVGNLQWAAMQDWMCEPAILARTGLDVAEHQRRTNYLELRFLAVDLPVVPVLQGWTRDDYHRCVDLYANAGVDLQAAPLVGLGSVCRRQGTTEIGAIVRSLAGHGLRLHGFGVKTEGLTHYSHALASADSMAWSYQARREPPLLGCARHRNCANCLRYALAWRERVLRRCTDAEQLPFDFGDDGGQ